MNVMKETVTPKKAMEWLKRNVANRPVSRTAVDRYAAAMDAGAWKLNGDCIRFNGNGDMIDGQHRLTACIQSGKPFEAYIVRGLEHEAFDTIDQGRKRTVGDVFARHGYKHYTTLASAVRNLWRYENGFIGSRGEMRADQANELLEKHPAIHAGVETSREILGRSRLMNPGALAFLIYATSQISEAAAQKFWPAVMTGEGLNKQMAAYWLRERLISNVGSKAKLHADTVVALCIKAWNSHRSGKPCKNLKWADNEEFPVIQ